VKIRNAPRYQGRLPLEDRVQVRDSTGWRAASADELGAICADDGDVSVIGIPRHLLERWWKLAEADHITKGFDGYGREIAEYFVYKNWRLTAPVLMEVVAAGGKRDKALMPSHPMRFATGVGTLSACINLGGENAAIALKADSRRVRIILEPGEGLLMPADGVLFNRSVLGGSELAVTLLIGSLGTE
jgi:hypothetical protein